MLSAPVFAGGFATAMYLRFGELPGPVNGTQVAVLTALAAVVKATTFWRLGIFRIRVRHLAFDDLVRISKAVTFSSLLFVVASYCMYVDKPLSRGVWLLDWGTTLLICGAVASSRRWIADVRRERRRRQQAGENTKRILIAGTGTAAELMLRAIRQHPEAHYETVGILIESKSSQGITIGGLPVLGNVDEAETIAAERTIDEIVITANDLPGKTIRSLVNRVSELKTKVTVLPSFQQLLSGEVAMQPREVQIEDLLGRDPVTLDTRIIEQWLAGRTIAITGSSGSIGSEVCRQLIPFAPTRMILIDQNESGQFFLERELRQLIAEAGTSTELITKIADIRDAARMSQLFREEQPEVMFHAAAYKHVPLMESNPGEAVKVNVMGTRMLADLAHQNGLESFVMVSTDKAVNPTSLMGATKRVAELYVQGLSERSNTRFVTVRFGNVLGSAGSVVPIFKQQIAAGGPVTVTHPDMVRYFMTIPEASQLIIQAGGQGQGGDVFVLDMGEPVKIVDLARDLIRLSGLTIGEDIELVFTGTRPGEKLYEELYLDGEERLPTAHPKILAASSQQVPMPELRAAISDLADVSENGLGHIEQVIAGLVPTFRKLAAPAGTETRKAA